jgi:hypothetical protein
MSSQDTTNHLFINALTGFVELHKNAPRKLIAARELFISYFNAPNDEEAREEFAAYEACEDMCLAHRMGTK